MKNFIILVAVLLMMLSACKKEPNEPEVPGTATGDTTKILTLVEYNYNNGNIDDSTIRTLTGITGDGGTKYIITVTYPNDPGDTAYTAYKLNLQNQLTEVAYTESSDPDSYDRSTYTWEGNNVIKIENDASGETKHAYNFNYSSMGANTRITFTEQPPKHSDTLFNGEHVQYYEDHKSAFIVSTADFKPVGIEAESYIYLSNNPANPPTIIRDTINTRFILSATGDLQQKIMIDSRIDTNSNGHIGINSRYNDSLVYNYTRDNSSSDSFANVFKNLFGNQLFVLSYFYSNEFVPNDLIPEGFDNDFFINHPLNKVSSSEFSWENGIPGNNNGQLLDEIVYENSYDSQNRLIAAKRVIPSTHQAEYGFKIIWP